MEDLRHTARALLQRNELGLFDLWTHYWNLGGRCHPFDLDAFIYEVVPVPSFDVVVLESAVRQLALEVVA